MEALSFKEKYSHLSIFCKNKDKSLQMHLGKCVLLPLNKVELFVYSLKRYVRWKHGDGGIRLWDCFSSTGTQVLLWVQGTTV